MILIDFNQVLMSSIMTLSRKNAKIDEDFFRHIVLNIIRSVRIKFYKQYGEIILAADSKHSWRKDVFLNYKIKRKEARQSSGLDWSCLFKLMDMIKEELHHHFPYILLEIEGAEADDIIATLCSSYPKKDENILIISSDKDFLQLKKFDYVFLYDPIKKIYKDEPFPHKFLKKHIIIGDESDSIPNILSTDDVFVIENGRQKPLKKSNIELWSSLGTAEEFCNEEMLRNWKRNRQLIDFSYIPTSISEDINKEYNYQSSMPRSRSKLLNYFIQHKLKNLTEVIGDF